MTIPLPEGVHPLLWFNDLIVVIAVGAAATMTLVFNQITIKKYKALKKRVKKLEESVSNVDKAQTD